MPSLTVLLVVSVAGPFTLHCLEALLYLRERYTLDLRLIDNGAQLTAQQCAQLSPATLYRFPLRLLPGVVLEACLPRCQKVSVLLWWQAECELPVARLAGWLAVLDQWTALHPRFTGQRSAEVIENEYQPSCLQIFPPCLLFAAEQLETIRLWAAPGEQMPLMLMGCDTQVEARFTGRPVVLSALPALTLSEGLERFKHARKADLPRKRVLLESLQRAFPDSLAILKDLIPRLPLTEALPLLCRLLVDKQFQPELLAWTSQALLAAGHTAEAIRIKHLLDLFEPSFRLGLSPWPHQTELSLYDLPYAASLTVVIVFNTTSTSEHIQHTLHTLQAVPASVVLLSTTEIAALLPDTLVSVCAGVYLRLAGESFLNFSRRVQAEIQTDWVLILYAGEQLQPQDCVVIQQWLWLPPSSDRVLCASVSLLTPEGAVVSVSRQIRLFSAQTLFLVAADGTLEPSAEASWPLQSLNLTLQRRQALHPASAKRQAALELAHQQAWEPAARALALQVRTKKGRQHPETYLTWLRALAETEQWETLASECAQLPAAWCQGPDFFCLQGMLWRQARRFTEARLSLERCLNFSPDERKCLPWYSPESLNQWPLRELAEVYWQEIFTGTPEIRVRQDRIRELRRTLYALMLLYPDGQPVSGTWSLFLLQALAAVLAAHYQPGHSPRDLFLQNMPSGCAEDLRVYYSSTVLLFLQGQISGLSEHLPPGYSDELIRELRQNPPALMSFCESLWAQPAFDGPELARLFLVCGAVFFRDITLLLWLVRLQQRAGLQAEARFSLNRAGLIFAGHPLLSGVQL
jgi:hypothetical protein